MSIQSNCQCYQLESCCVAVTNVPVSEFSLEISALEKGRTFILFNFTCCFALKIWSVKDNCFKDFCVLVNIFLTDCQNRYLGICLQF